MHRRHHDESPSQKRNTRRVRASKKKKKDDEQIELVDGMHPALAVFVTMLALIAVSALIHFAF
jgi:hypothetical protein